MDFHDMGFRPPEHGEKVGNLSFGRFALGPSDPDDSSLVAAVASHYLREMKDCCLQWRTNLRGNMVLWPAPTSNLTAILRLDGAEYNEEEFLSKLPLGEKSKAPETTRSIRNTVEVMNISGLAFRSPGPPKKFILTDLGRLTAEYLGVLETEKLANTANIHLLGHCFIRGLCCVAEYRAIWELMLASDSMLSNEELNRAFPNLNKLSDVKATAEKVLKAREQNDLLILGPRLYENDKYEDKASRSDQRKALNPWFLLAGAGGILISLDKGKEHRTFPEWVKKPILTALKAPCEIVNLDHPKIAQQIDKYSGAPKTSRKG